MACYIARTRSDKFPIFMCGDLGPHCADQTCAAPSEFLCDYPVGDGKTCDKPLCSQHAYEVGPDIHYCAGHMKMWKKHCDAAGVAPFASHVSEEPTEPDIKAAADLGDILADIVGRPLTAEEVARTHQHVRTINAIFDAAYAKAADDDEL